MRSLLASVARTAGGGSSTTSAVCMVILERGEGAEAKPFSKFWPRGGGGRERVVKREGCVFFFFLPRRSSRPREKTLSLFYPRMGVAKVYCKRRRGTALSKRPVKNVVTESSHASEKSPFFFFLLPFFTALSRYICFLFFLLRRRTLFRSRAGHSVVPTTGQTFIRARDAGKVLREAWNVS